MTSPIESRISEQTMLVVSVFGTVFVLEWLYYMLLQVIYEPEHYCWEFQQALVSQNVYDSPVYVFTACFVLISIWSLSSTLVMFRNSAIRTDKIISTIVTLSMIYVVTSQIHFIQTAHYLNSEKTTEFSTVGTHLFPIEYIVVKAKKLEPGTYPEYISWEQFYKQHHCPPQNPFQIVPRSEIKRLRMEHEEIMIRAWAEFYGEDSTGYRLMRSPMNEDRIEKITEENFGRYLYP